MELSAVAATGGGGAVGAAGDSGGFCAGGVVGIPEGTGAPGTGAPGTGTPGTGAPGTVELPPAAGTITGTPDNPV